MTSRPGTLDTFPDTVNPNSSTARLLREATVNRSIEELEKRLAMRNSPWRVSQGGHSPELQHRLANRRGASGNTGFPWLTSPAQLEAQAGPEPVLDAPHWMETTAIILLICAVAAFLAFATHQAWPQFWPTVWQAVASFAYGG